MRQITVAIAGLGSRGLDAYARFQERAPEQMRIVAVADPRGERVQVGALAPLEEILHGPGRSADGMTNFVGALRRAMATTGYTDPKEFQRVEVIVAPHQRS